ncbi:MAG TPA: CrcB family protein [Cryptosporangiaceae bacterium]|nr:CrcB family protein [Cryptosporangiaceae bacterium]
MSGPLWAVVGVVSTGGALGALGRHAVTLAYGDPPGAFPWGTLTVNASGCFLIGLLMAWVTIHAGPSARLVRPFLGTGVLGGYTTFSAYVVDAHLLLRAGRSALVLAYVAGTLAVALGAVWCGAALARRVLPGVTGGSM